MQAQQWIDTTMNSMKRQYKEQKKLPRLIGITGKKGTGKDTVAEYLRNQYDYHILKFADPLKWAVTAMFGLPRDVLESRELKEKPLSWLGASPRWLMQTLGTEWGRHQIHPDIWVLLMRQRLRAHLADSVVIPDVRFNNEAEFIQGLGGVVISITVPGPATVDVHTSENGISPGLIDTTIINSGTVRELYIEALSVLESLA